MRKSHVVGKSSWRKSIYICAIQLGTDPTHFGYICVKVFTYRSLVQLQSQPESSTVFLCVSPQLVGRPDLREPTHTNILLPVPGSHLARYFRPFTTPIHLRAVFSSETQQDNIPVQQNSFAVYGACAGGVTVPVSKPWQPLTTVLFGHKLYFLVAKKKQLQ